jgi:hypothetical protein
MQPSLLVAGEIRRVASGQSVPQVLRRLVDVIGANVLKDDLDACMTLCLA